MTTHYIDISLLPDPEFSQAHLLGALMSKLHRALVQHGAGDIGVSFPQHANAHRHKRSLGNVLRLHGTDEALQTLMEQNWLKGMHDHVQLSPIAVAPQGAPHCLVLRRQFKTSAERLRRRRMQRKGETAEQAAAAIPDSVERSPDLPYAQLRSHSTGQPFCLFIAHGPLLSSTLTGRFNTYGLGPHASVPWF